MAQKRFKKSFFSPFFKENRLQQHFWHAFGIMEGKSSQQASNEIHIRQQKTLKIAIMNIQPLADRVLLKQEKAETTTKSGIILPEAAQEKTQTATVEAVGPGTEKEKITVKVGDRVMYDKYSGVQVKMDGEEYLIVKNSDIIAVVE